MNESTPMYSRIDFVTNARKCFGNMACVTLCAG